MKESRRFVVRGKLSCHWWNDRNWQQKQNRPKFPSLREDENSHADKLFRLSFSKLLWEVHISMTACCRRINGGHSIEVSFVRSAASVYCSELLGFILGIFTVLYDSFTMADHNEVALHFRKHFSVFICFTDFTVYRWALDANGKQFYHCGRNKGHSILMIYEWTSSY